MVQNPLPSNLGASLQLRGIGAGQYVLALVILVLGFYFLVPLGYLLAMSFNVAADLLGHWQFGLDNWVAAWQRPGLLASIGNSILIWFFTVSISLPLAVTIAWALARSNIPWAGPLEYLFWVALVFPTLSSTLGWIMVFDPVVGYANTLWQMLTGSDSTPFNIFSVPGIVWARLMADGIAYKVILLTPAFRNMDKAMEDAARVSGASGLVAVWRVTLPMMAAPILLVLALQVIKMFDGFETEQLLGAPWGFYVYSTQIYKLVNTPGLDSYPAAIVLAMLTFAIIVVIFPLQRWITRRRHYIAVSGNFKTGLVDLGRWRLPVFGAIALLLFLLTALPILMLVVGSFMVRAGYFNTTVVWTLEHWAYVLSDPQFLSALKTTLLLAVVGGIGSPILFAIIAYLIVKTRLRGRDLLDSMIWISAGLPGVIFGLGLMMMFLSVPFLTFLYGSIWALMLVMVISGNTTGTNLFKGVLVQLDEELESAARVAGAGWLTTFFRIVLPLLMPTMVMVGILNFASAAGATSSIVLLASRETTTLSLLTLEYASPEIGRREEAGIVSLFIMALTLGSAFVARRFAARIGIGQPLESIHDGAPGQQLPTLHGNIIRPGDKP